MHRFETRVLAVIISQNNSSYKQNFFEVEIVHLMKSQYAFPSLWATIIYMFIYVDTRPLCDFTN